MHQRYRIHVGLGFLAVLGALFIAQGALQRSAIVEAQQRPAVPRFEVDPTWPKLPENMILGTISGIYAASQDRIWVVHRPSTVAPNDLASAQKTPCCVPAPPVIEFDAAGNYIQGWGEGGTEVHAGGRGQLPGRETRQKNAAGYYWPRHEHGIHVDHKGNVWIGGNGLGDNHILKFTRAGKFLLQIGNPAEVEKATGNLDTKNMQLPAKMWVSPTSNEVFVADGYMNRRVVVFDADTGAFKRYWSAYGNKPTDPPVFSDHGTPRETIASGRGPEQFNLPHGIALSKDNLVYVADRLNNRAQVFSPDGKYINEVFVARTTLGNGTVFDLDVSPDGNFLYIADNTNGQMRIIDRKTMQQVGAFGRPGRQAGQFDRLHSMAVDSKGNIYTGETNGRKVQKFVFKGTGTAATQ